MFFSFLAPSAKTFDLCKISFPLLQFAPFKPNMECEPEKLFSIRFARFVWHSVPLLRRFTFSPSSFSRKLKSVVAWTTLKTEIHQNILCFKLPLPIFTITVPRGINPLHFTVLLSFLHFENCLNCSTEFHAEVLNENTREDYLQCCHPRLGSELKKLKLMLPTFWFSTYVEISPQNKISQEMYTAQVSQLN